MNQVKQHLQVCSSVVVLRKYAIHTSTYCDGRYNRDEVVGSLGREINLNPPLTLGQLPDTTEELLKLDQVFVKSELKVGVIYVKEGQYTEEEILDNNEHSDNFNEFLTILGDRVRLKGFDKYKGGLDTVHDLTGLHSVYTHWRGIGRTTFIIIILILCHKSLFQHNFLLK